MGCILFDESGQAREEADGITQEASALPLLQGIAQEAGGDVALVMRF
ncbi:hypothetical protein M2413_004734 [Pseudomonas putida]|nr:hypothetical protein [Pseudomonas putida]